MPISIRPINTYKMEDNTINNVIECLQELSDDMSVPKNVKYKIENTIRFLKEDLDISIKVNKALNELDDVADDSNMQPYTRTQLWNVVSLLETLS